MVGCYGCLWTLFCGAMLMFGVEGEYCLVHSCTRPVQPVPGYLVIYLVRVCVHTGTVHVVQERMDILPYMCVPYTGVRWGGWGAGGENQKNGTRVQPISQYIILFQYFNKPTTLANMRRPTAGDVNILSG